MRRDVCYYFEAGVKDVYNAYLRAATNLKFRRNCSQEPYHTISFGLNFSVKYNMNFGACTIHFMPHKSGTAVDLRFSLAQLFGAQYERYARDLTEDAGKVLGLPAQIMTVGIREFLKTDSKVSAGTIIDPEPAGAACDDGVKTGDSSVYTYAEQGYVNPAPQPDVYYNSVNTQPEVKNANCESGNSVLKSTVPEERSSGSKMAENTTNQKNGGRKTEPEFASGSLDI